MAAHSSPIDRLVNPERLQVPLGRLRLNPVALLMLGAVFYLAASSGWKAILITFAAVSVLYVVPLLELSRARSGKYSWMYRDLALERVKRAMIEGRVDLDEREREVVSYLAAQSSQLADQHSVEMLLQHDRVPFFSHDGREERRQALEHLVGRGLVKRSKSCAEVVSLELRPLVALT